MKETALTEAVEYIIEPGKQTLILDIYGHARSFRFSIFPLLQVCQKAGLDGSHHALKTPRRTM
jgi:hypothetical protein